MRAAVCRSHGPPEVVATDDLPAPPIGPGQVRVRVDAAAVNFPDVLLVADRYQLTVPTPFVPGSEFAGTVAEVAENVLYKTALASDERGVARTEEGM